MRLWDKLTGRKPENPAAALYQAVVARGREPHWYEAGAVPDSVNGRFDMIASVLAMVMLRIEHDADAAVTTARLTECFVDDMDGQLRQIGIGDVVVGKGIGKMMALLGGRIGAYRDALAEGAEPGAFEAALLRNLYRGEDPGADAVAHSATGLRDLRARLAGVTHEDLLTGRLP
ncbi:MAG: ubiquinol-cytochrome C chaperone family protein [Sphingomonas sp.]